MEPAFAIVIVAFRSGAVLQSLVDALGAQTRADFEVVIVDNACPDGSVEALALPDARFRTIRAGHNLGFAGGCNLGARATSAPWIVTLNPDTCPDADWLGSLADAIARWPEGRIFGCTQLAMDAPGKMDALGKVDGFGDVLSIFGVSWRGGYGQPVRQLPDADIVVLSPCAAAAIYHRETFERLGGFDESYFCYLEDVDLGLRFRASGHDTIQLRDVSVPHAGSEGSVAPLGFAADQSARNMPRLLIKTTPAPLLLPTLAVALLSRTYLAIRNRPSLSGALREIGSFGAALFARTHWAARADTPKLPTGSWLRSVSRSRSELRHRSIRALDPVDSTRWTAAGRSQRR